jgi:hypothetical protein
LCIAKTSSSNVQNRLFSNKSKNCFIPIEVAEIPHGDRLVISKQRGGGCIVKMAVQCELSEISGETWSSLWKCASSTLVTKGVYRRARHPMYSAFWLWALAPGAAA